MRMYLEDLNNPEVLYKHVTSVRNVQWFDDKGEPVDDETSELANNYTEYAMMCRTGEQQPIPYNEWLLVDGSIKELSLAKPVDPKFLQDLDAEQSILTRYNEYVDVCEDNGIISKNYEEWSVKADTKDVAILDEEEESILRHNEYIKLCQQESADPLDYWDWLPFDEKYQEHLRTAGSPLSPATFRRMQQVDKQVPTIAELQKEIEDLKIKRERAIFFKCEAEKETNRVGKELIQLRSELIRITCERDNLLVGQKQSYSDEDYESLLAIRDELVLENEALIKELSAAGQRTTPANHPLYPHYYRDVSGVSHVDVYWILQAWNVANPSVQHAVKKLLAAGQRGAKDILQDLNEARNSINRAIELERK